MVASTCKIPFLVDIKFTEAIVVQKGINLAIDTSLIPVMVEFDPQSVVNPINKKNL